MQKFNCNIKNKINMETKTIQLSFEQQQLLINMLKHQIDLISDRIKNLDDFIRNASVNSTFYLESKSNQKDVEDRNKLKTKMDHMIVILESIK